MGAPGPTTLELDANEDEKQVHSIVLMSIYDDGDDGDGDGDDDDDRSSLPMSIATAAQPPVGLAGPFSYTAITLET